MVATVDLVRLEMLTVRRFDTAGHEALEKCTNATDVAKLLAKPGDQGSPLPQRALARLLGSCKAQKPAKEWLLGYWGSLLSHVLHWVQGSARHAGRHQVESADIVSVVRSEALLFAGYGHMVASGGAAPADCIPPLSDVGA